MKEEPHYTGHRERLRARLLRDPRQLADYELLELLLAQVVPRRDTKPLAKALLASCGSLGGVFAARPEELRRVPGFGPALEAFWTLWRETWARASESPVRQREVLDSPAGVAAMARARLADRTTEELWLALVDAKNRLVGWERVGQGSVDEVAVPVREVLHAALRFEAHGVVLVHNHPGGDPQPSESDIRFTRRLDEAARAVGVRLLDHLVVASGGYASFRSLGLLG
jgi:DNA repair protein RadC